MKLVILLNNLIDEIPRSFKVAEAMMDMLKPPKEICDFIRLWIYMVDDFRARIKRSC